ncbi:cytochrome b5-like [Pectinophora gossypiella]|uniref:cytochrome b5-like n=1 Tax=Pectinophora gossypiella TaxID=13191 RepID=UPI00214EA505|nr:cytochrome b5-like [Pectinophora gossypiella]
MSQQFTRKQVAERASGAKSTLFIIDNVVYDVTPFLDEHPGGHEVLVNVAGKDASEDFDDIGHSLDAKTLMKKYVVGEVVAEERVEVKRRPVSWDDQRAEDGPGFLSSWKFPVLLGIVATVLYSYLFG